MNLDILKIANKKFKSRLIVGTGKYKNMQECAKAIKISGAEIVTVAVRRVNILDRSKPLLMDYINPKKIIQDINIPIQGGLNPEILLTNKEVHNQHVNQ